MSHFRVPVAIVIAVLVGATLAGCTAGSTGSNSSAVGSAIAPDTGSAPSESNTQAADRQVISSGTVSITVSKPRAATDAAVRIVESAGGRIDGRDERAAAGGQPGWSRLTVRIPAADLTRTLGALKGLGSVHSVALSAQDVTAESTDVDARITALRASVVRLVELESRAATTADLITIETALSDRQQDLESLEAQKRSTDDSVAFATITLDLRTAQPAVAPGNGTFLSGLDAGWQSLVAVLSVALVALGAVFPWLVLAFGAAVAIRAVVRRRRRTGADPARSAS